jgi:LysR family transcriptional repressor of citA
MDLKWLKTFLIAAKYENFRQAAEELFLTQPAVTKHIQKLEENLQIQLFKRHGRKVSLTPTGYKFLPYAREMISKYENGIEEFESWKQGYSHKLVIAIAPQLASSILPSLLRRFINNHSDIEMIINVVKSYEIGEEISAGRADLGLTKMRPVQTNVNSVVLYEESVTLVGPNEKGNSILDEETMLRKYRLLTHNHPDYWESLLFEIKKHYPTVRTMRVNQVEVTKRFIEEGLGVSYLPLTMVKEEIKQKKIIEIAPTLITPPKSSTYLVTKIETKEARIFIDFLREQLRNIST